jgi:hypothetical protein
MAKPNTAATRRWRQRNPEYFVNWRKKHKKQEAARLKKWYADHPEYVEHIRQQYHKPGGKARKRAYYLQKAYGLTVVEYADLRQKQNDRCAICEKPFGETRMKTPFVDHDHKTGKVRALLCGKCNAMLGMANDTVAILEKAVVYLKTHEASNGLCK